MLSYEATRISSPKIRRCCPRLGRDLPSFWYILPKAYDENAPQASGQRALDVLELMLGALVWSAEQEQLDNLMVQVLAESHTSSFNGSSALVAIVPTQRPSRISEWNSRKDPLVARRPIPRWGMTGLRCLPDKRAAIRADGLTFLREFFTRRFDYQEDRFGDLGTDENGWAMVGCAFGSFRS